MLQRLARAVYPSQCLACGDIVAEAGGLCGACWPATPFSGPVTCTSCGQSLPGSPDQADDPLCDSCLESDPPWDRGWSAFRYAGQARKMILALKHGDRTDLAQPLARFLAQAVPADLPADTLVVPVPLHWIREAQRRYNQAALLADHLAGYLGLDVAPRALCRPKPTRPLDGHSRDARFAELDGSIVLHKRFGPVTDGRPILLIDDVMTSGATFTSSTRALLAGGAGPVCIAALARVGKDT